MVLATLYPTPHPGRNCTTSNRFFFFLFFASFAVASAAAAPSAAGAVLVLRALCAVGDASPRDRRSRPIARCAMAIGRRRWFSTRSGQVTAEGGGCELRRVGVRGRPGEAAAGARALRGFCIGGRRSPGVGFG